LIIRVSGTITGNEAIRVESNKSILGRPGAHLVGIGFTIGRSSAFGQVSNVIIRNLIMEKPLAPIDKVTVQYGAHHVWIDHNEFFSDLDHGIDFYDGQVDLTHGADFITISWNVFHDHFKNSLVGNSENTGDEDSGHLRVTYHHNLFTRVDGRNPSIRFGTGPRLQQPLPGHSGLRDRLPPERPGPGREQLLRQRRDADPRGYQPQRRPRVREPGEHERLRELRPQQHHHACGELRSALQQSPGSGGERARDRPAGRGGGEGDVLAAREPAIRSRVPAPSGARPRAARGGLEGVDYPPVASACLADPSLTQDRVRPCHRRTRTDARKRRGKTHHGSPMHAIFRWSCPCRGADRAAAIACAGKPEAPPAAIPSPAEADLPEAASPYDALPEAVRAVMDKPFTGDFDELVKRRAIRVGVTFNRTHYFIDNGQERGLAYESVKAFETDLNTELKTGNLKVHVIMVPMTREQLYPALVSGKVDMVAAMVTVTPEREKLAAFSQPTRTNVSEVVVTGPGAPPISTVDDLAGQEVFVRKGSTYNESLDRVNEQLKARGKPAVIIDEAPGCWKTTTSSRWSTPASLPITVVDDYLADFWSKVFTGIKVHRDVSLRSGGNLAVAFRKENPKLRAAVDAWLRKHGKATPSGTSSSAATWTASSTRRTPRRRRAQEAACGARAIQKYGKQYDVDYLLMVAQGYQESTLDQNVKSPVGAIGVMQVMPPTGKELNVGDITKIEPNIHAGVKYVRFMQDQYFKDEPMDNLNKGLMTFAAYNCGPGRLRQLRRETEQRGLDPNVWFGNVERVASERIGRETVTYVSNIYKYYIAYKLWADQQERRSAAKAEVRKHQ
jgi:membrane-bound lytic murein transglycosylase MltF